MSKNEPRTEEMTVVPERIVVEVGCLKIETVENGIAVEIDGKRQELVTAFELNLPGPDTFPTFTLTRIIPPWGD